MIQVTLEQLITLAKEAEKVNPIEWGDLPIDEDLIYRTIAGGVYLAYTKLSPETKDIISLAGLIKLNVENFVLRQRIYQLEKTIVGLNASNRNK